MNFTINLTGLVSKYVYTDAVQATLRKIFVKSRIRTLVNIILKSHYQEGLEIEIMGEKVRFNTPDFEEYLILTGINSDESVMEDIARNLDEGSVFYDVGANVGLYSCTIAKLTDCKVYSFEPHPENSKRLKQNLEKNNPSFEIVEKALCDSNGWENIDADKMVAGEGQASLVSSEEGLKVETTRMDCLEDNYSKADVIKIDVEGAELKVLQGMENIENAKMPDLIYCELHPTVNNMEAQ